MRNRRDDTREHRGIPVAVIVAVTKAVLRMRHLNQFKNWEKARRTGVGATQGR